VRTWWRQEKELAAVEHQLGALRSANASLEERQDALQRPERIEELARGYNLVRPNTESYAILPLPEAPLPVPPGWPFTGLVDELHPATG
jgi:hypothetical protein